MLNLYELEQLTAFARYGTLSKTAEELHISQPTLTRTMQHLETEFGVPLFVRGMNRRPLNEAGRKA
ncbi:MAG: LysR family transcriptional regulator, partial [Oscillospiraceae bacterium]|nr:LysR family transcriptional regulator [Oscillospiraceae bacterium]